MSEDSATILIVDDDVVNIKILVDLLKNECKVLVATNGEQALKRATGTPRPDLILLDVIMPDMDGFEVCRRLKDNKVTASIPIIFITSKDACKDETQGLALGAVDYIRKPFIPAVALARIQAHLFLRKQSEKLQDLNNLKNKFIGIAAHDLRNPLASICGFSDALLTMELTEMERAQYVQTIHDVATQMLKLIHDLLDVSVIESGHFILDKRAADLTALVKARVQLMRFGAEKKGVVILLDLQPTPLTNFDSDRLAQVVDNLISNAVKFTPPNTQVTVRTGQQDDRIFFQVMDQGPGVPEADRHRLFGAFQKLSVLPTAQEKGTGLGLCIVKNIVDAHHGEITVVNNSDQGATFTCFLPGVEPLREVL
ncbi:MAG: hybrid sensor histidine kinase/response regulator [Magnetococcales bacterium]|nr:hybrid sensor histidine kinase/response regulator [Magnetococcales bacterium]MBF0438236.1 hybrid sensor histidine kinase/response regulator [Magnetococcales bacterium]